VHWRSNHDHFVQDPPHATSYLLEHPRETDAPSGRSTNVRVGMKIIMNVRITQGYAKWVELFRSAGAVREQFDITVLAYGHDKDDDSSVYQVLEVESMERMQEAMSNPELQKMRTDAGVDLESQRITFLVE